MLILIPGFSYGQETNTTQVKFISVYSSQSCPMPPFAKIETGISNNQICYRNVLPPRNQINENHLYLYDSWDTIPGFQKIEPVDYDSIVNFILTSGLLNIDLNYTKPDTTGGVICEKMGGCSYQYIIETSEGELELLIFGSQVFKLPELVKDFDTLFKRITGKYSDGNK
jgi:hypothetical protein